MSLHLLEHLTSVAARMRVAKHVLIGLDYDGTLTPLVDDPGRALIGMETRETVKALAAVPGVTVAIVSGRSLHNVRTLMELDGLIYAGNHGLEISGQGLDFLEPSSARMRNAVDTLALTLSKDLAHIYGVMVENKSLSMSVHYRRVHRDEHDIVVRHVYAAADASLDRFQVRNGNKICEVIPQVEWHKGAAMAWIADRIAVRDSLVIYLGDDRTDEDAFRTHLGGITVKVGEPGVTSAQYFLEGPNAVRVFLDWITKANIVEEKS